MFPFALVPHRMDVAGGRRAGQFAGSLGGKYDPLLTGGNPNDDSFKLDNLPLAPAAPPEALQRRLSLVDQLNAQTRDLNELAISQAIHDNQGRALEVLSSEAVRRAVDLASENPDERARYGRNLFGQSVLLGKRLLEAGARLVQCNWQRTQGRDGFAWDTHWNNFRAHKEDLVPPFDLAFDALMTDLERSGRLEETLVVVAAEFGRSPKVTRSNAGREHWPDCYSVLFAGGGVRPGVVHGQSDKIGAFPATDPLTPADFTATIYHLLGVDPRTETHDQTGRPLILSQGKPIGAVVGE
jgi:arylsulfatase A-like enzyme